MKHQAEYREPELIKKLLEGVGRLDLSGGARVMEVCGTHTMALFRSGIRGLLPKGVVLLSGPGCPVCVTSQAEIDAMIALSQMDIILTTFGDLMRVPGTYSSLQRERAHGADIRVTYSAFDAVELATKHPDRHIVFAGVGFETTAPTIAACIKLAAERNLNNFSVFSAHKLVPPALFALLEAKQAPVDGFLLPGHVSVIIGQNAYQPFFERHRIPCVIAGFEPGDVAQALQRLIIAIVSRQPALENAYPRAVTPQGNVKAQMIMRQVFEVVDATWRGLGQIAGSGLAIRNEFAAWDATRRFAIPVIESHEPKGCACGQILTGALSPPQCPLYKTACTPEYPVGPCMVSSEGTCAAFIKYHDAEG